MPTPVLRIQLEPWLLSGPQKKLLRAEFELALSAADFSAPEQTRKRLKIGRKKPGVYFWIVRASKREYRAYIGQTTDLSYRLGNYLSPFQPNATNDFKLKIFYDLVLEAEPNATFDLYFRPLNGVRKDSPRRRTLLREAERSALDQFSGALVNQRGMPSEAAKHGLRGAYEEFYRDNLRSILATTLAG